MAPEVESRGDGKGSLTRDAPDGVTSMEDLLRWPFFDEVHRDACRAFQEGLASKLGDLEAGGEDAADVFALSRTAIRCLAKQGGFDTSSPRVPQVPHRVRMRGSFVSSAR